MKLTGRKELRMLETLRPGMEMKAGCGRKESFK